jgi:hypothetical protein
MDHVWLLMRLASPQESVILPLVLALHLLSDDWIAYVIFRSGSVCLSINQCKPLSELTGTLLL